MSLTDSWFHLTTQSINLPQLSFNPTPTLKYGRDITSTCTNGYYDDSGATAVDLGLNYTNPDGTENNPLLPFSLVSNDRKTQITNATEAFSTANNVSSMNSVMMIAYLSQSSAVFVEAEPSTDIEFTARTFAASTQCTPIETQCFHSYSAEPAIFDCPTRNFSGIISTSDMIKRGEILPPDLYPDWTIGYVDNDTNTTTIDSLAFIQYPNLSNYTWILNTSIFDSSGPMFFALACNTSIVNAA